MAITEGVNAGFVTSAPTADPAGDGTRTMDNYKRSVQDTTDSTNILVTEIGWWCDNATEAGTYQIGIYEDDAGAPGDRLYVSTGHAKGTSSGWKVVSGLSWLLSANTTYWIALALTDTATATNTDYGTGTQYAYQSGESTLPDPYGTTSYFSEQTLSIYALVEPSAAAEIEQEGFRFYDDDGDEDESTALANQDTDISIAKQTNFRPRIIANATGDPASGQFTLQYKRDDEAATEWRNV